MRKPQRLIRNTPASTLRFRSVPHAVDNLLPNLDPGSREHAILSILREHAVGSSNAKCWKEIQPHLRRLGHDSYKKREFQTGWLQICRPIGCFIASCQRGFYLPRDSKDYAAYEIATVSRICGEQANLRQARKLMKQQEECEASERACRLRTRTTARRPGANRPTTTKTPRKTRSKGRRPTRS